jgi:hypothetical protein
MGVPPIGSSEWSRQPRLERIAKLFDVRESSLSLGAPLHPLSRSYIGGVWRHLLATLTTRD